MSRNQEIRQEVLLQLYGMRPIPLSAYDITRRARSARFDFTEREIQAECEFLKGQKLAESVVDPVSGETRYVVSSDGVMAQEKGLQ